MKTHFSLLFTRPRPTYGTFIGSTSSFLVALKFQYVNIHMYIQCTLKASDIGVFFQIVGIRFTKQSFV